MDKNVQDCIVIGAGASGLFYAAGDDSAVSGGKLILEKTAHPGQKLLMSGNGMCNITHAGSIKDFINRYGEHGKQIRTCLYKHNNLELMSMMESLGVPLTERPDGKVFPASMKARDILDALLAKASASGWTIRCKAEVMAITWEPDAIKVTLDSGDCFVTKKLIIATGGASYPSTGSDGSFFDVLRRDLGLTIIDPKPALAPVYVQNYPYKSLAGISFDDVEVSCNAHQSRGPLLLTHKGFSGPAILHISQYAKPGAILRINYLPAHSISEVFQKLRADQPGNSKGIANYISSEFGLPKAFAETMFADPTRKFSTIGHKELENVAHLMMDRVYSVSGTGGWNEAMVTAGGVALDQIDRKTMEAKGMHGLCIIGEALDINGDTGGYNLQFAYSSAMAAVEAVSASSLNES